MGRPVSMWLYLFTIFLGLLFTVAFGWAVKSTMSGNDRSGVLGEIAVEIASFPTLAKNVLAELTGYATGDYKDEAIRVPRETTDLTLFAPVATAPGIDLQGLMVRADPANLTAGWRVLVGAFQINGDIENAALLVAPDLTVARTWILDEIQIGEEEVRPKHRKFVHGFEILRDGSVIFTFDGSISLQKFNACGGREWAIPGGFHHAVTLDESGDSVWALKRPGFARVAAADGSTLRSFSMDDIIAANPMIDILEIRRVHGGDLGKNSRDTKGRWLDDPFHLNDVDPLPAALADRFEGFAAGDLLVSARSLNLVFVLNPETLEIKWWRAGAVQRQHDPDWGASGEITIYNNRMSRDFSEIVALDPGTMKKRVLLDGREHAFYSRIRGKHQVLVNGTLIVTSPQQGRAFELDGDGDVVLEVLNTKPGSADTNYVISELKWLPPNYFDAGVWDCPAPN